MLKENHTMSFQYTPPQGPLTPAPPPPPQPEPPRKRHWLRNSIIALVALTVGLGVIGATVGNSDSPKSHVGANIVTTTSPTYPSESVTAATDEPTAIPKVADPQGRFKGSCDMVLGDFMSDDAKFVASGSFRNGGNVGVTVEVRVVWYLSDGRTVRKTKTFRVPWHQSRHYGMSVPISQSTVELYQAGEGYFSGDSCKVHGALLDTFGNVH
jgi:hypothetical protein